MNNKASQSVYLLRHGETDANKDRIVQGKSLNPLLNATGVRQAERVGRYLKKHFERPRLVCSSPMHRAVNTTNIVVSKLYGWLERPCLVEFIPGLEEIDYGDLEGKTWEEIRAIYPNPEEMYDGSLLDTEYPHGEKIRNAQKRVVEAFLRMLHHYPNESPILVVAHGGTLRLLVAWILKTEQIRSISHSNTGLSLIERIDNLWTVAFLNSTAHLL